MNNSDFALTHLGIEFRNALPPLSVWVKGPVVTYKADGWEQWQESVERNVREARGGAEWDPRYRYAVTLRFRFDPRVKNPNYTGENAFVDLDNCIKHVLDGVAAGLFREKGDKNLFREGIRRDDYNFWTLLIHRDPDAKQEGEEEGVRVVVSRVRRPPRSQA